MLEQKRAEVALVLGSTCGFSATQRFFCCCSARQRFTPMRKAAVTSSQLTESLSLRDKGPESSWWSLGGVKRWGELCVYVCLLCRSFHVCMFVGI